MDKDTLHTTRWKRSFLTIAAGEAVSLIGTSAVQFAMIWWLAVKTNSALMLSLAGLLAFLPQLLLGPFAGVWIDRWKRKTVIICSDIFMALVAGAFALLFLMGQPPYWTACVVLGVRALANVFYTPALQAAIPMLVPSEQLVRANGWNQFLQSGAFMLGPVLGAALYAVLPLPFIMLFDVAGAVVASVSVAVVKIPDPPKQEHVTPGFFREMKEGARILLKDTRLCITTVAATLCMVFYLPLSTLYPLMTSEHFKGTAWHAGIVEFVFALGMMVCSAIVSAMGDIRHKFRLIHIALIAFGAVTLVSGILPRHMSYFWIFVVLCALMGAGGNLYSIPYMSYLQQTIPPEAQGRVFSMVTSLMCLAMPVGLTFAGPMAEVYGVGTLFFICGAAVIVIMLLSGVLISATKKAKTV
jgi:DHA3 family macrolide efflux protein-like MFS transporter